MYYEPPLFGGAGAIRMITMHEKLWEGVELKISNAEFFLDQMGIASAVGADFDEYRLPRCAQRTMALVGNDLFMPTLTHFWRWAEVFPRS
jgi:hypothetical protein